MLKYARVLIDMPLEGPIPEYIKFCECFGYFGEAKGDI